MTANLHRFTVATLATALVLAASTGIGHARGDGQANEQRRAATLERLDEQRRHAVDRLQIADVSGKLPLRPADRRDSPGARFDGPDHSRWMSPWAAGDYTFPADVNASGR